VKLPIHEPSFDADGRVIGEIIHIDRYGNCVTNLTKLHLDSKGAYSLSIGGTNIGLIADNYTDSKNAGQPILYYGSAGYWEIGVWCDSASRTLGLSRGMRFNLRQLLK